MIVINPRMLHTSGKNDSKQKRRVINIGLVHEEFQPLLDHWKIVQNRYREINSPQVRELLGADRKPLDNDWDILPKELIKGLEIS